MIDQPAQLEEFMKSAILLNRVDFVKLFIESGVSFRELLKEDGILKFYEETSEMEKYLKQEKQSNSCNEKAVHHILKKRLGNSVSVTLNNEANEGTDRLLLLFLWAILKNYLHLAKLFWEEGKEGIAAALLAQKLLQAMAQQTDDPAEHTRLLKHMVFFESLAVGVLTECYEEDERKAQLLLTRRLPNFGGKTVLRLAAEADNKLFIANVACQSLLNRIWMGKMALSNGRRRLILSLVLPPLIFWWISFRDDAWNEIGSKSDEQSSSSLGGQSVDNEEVNEKNSGERLANSRRKLETREGKGFCFQKMCAFFYAPVVIFIVNSVSYVIFLALFSVILLTDFHQGFTRKEWLLVFWVGTLILEEIRQSKPHNGTS
ncbi:Transient receptor potential cation channel subfamily M member 2 [Lamellibrachia satsuma]|nr:Transient receptor potential cation channel subfamily M member 2 [Lamellibrachia satsuma]